MSGLSAGKRFSSFLNSFMEFPEKDANEERNSASGNSRGVKKTPKKNTPVNPLEGDDDDDSGEIPTLSITPVDSTREREPSPSAGGGLLARKSMDDARKASPKDSAAETELDALKKTNQKLKNRVASADAELGRLRAQLARAEEATKDKDNLQKKVKELQDKLGSMKSARDELQKSSVSSERRLVSLEDSSQMLQQQVAGLKACVQQLQESLDDREKENKELKKQLQDLRSSSDNDVTEARDKAKDLQKQVDYNAKLYEKAHSSLVSAQQLLGESEKSNAELKKRCLAAETEAAELKKRLEEAENDLKELRPRYAELQESTQMLSQSSAQNQETLKATTNQLEELKAAAEQAEQAKSSANQEISSMKEKIEQLEAKNKELNDTITEQKALMTTQTRKNTQMIRELKGELARLQSASTPTVVEAPTPGPEIRSAPTPAMEESSVNTEDFEVLGVHLGKLAEEKFAAEQKCERLEARVASLEAELSQWKSSTVQGYITAQLSRTESMIPRNGSQPTHHASSSSSSGRWFFGRKSASATPSPAQASTLSDEVMGKMQSIIEDTLVKNIQLQNDLGRLGDDYADLQRRYKQLEQQQQQQQQQEPKQEQTTSQTDEPQQK